MTRYFAQNTPRAGLEHMMMSVPGFQKRGGGMMILSRFCYKPEDVDAKVRDFWLEESMAREKIKFALRIAPETQQLVKELCERDNCQSQNEFIEKAIRFYAGYVSGKEATAYLPPALVAAMRGTVQDSENRIARLLFKLAVEVNMMMNVLAAGMEISDEDLKTLRARSVREVKQTNGRISFKDAIDYQRGVE